MTDMKVLSDVEFLRGVISDLDNGWVTGEMCDDTGKKCLVGAGATVLGFDYHAARTIRDNAKWVHAYNEACKFEAASAKRLGEILISDLAEDRARLSADYDEEYGSGAAEIDIAFGEFDAVDTLTGFNDGFGEYGPLRVVLVENLNRLEGN